MSTSPERVRTRAQRVASRVAYDGVTEKVRRVFENDGLLKLGLVALTAAAICALCSVWNPPFVFRLYSTSERDVVSRASFDVFSAEKTNRAKQIARFETPHVYARDSGRLTHYKAQLLNDVQTLIAYPDFEAISAEDRAKLRRFLSPNATEAEEKNAFLTLQRALEKDLDLANFKDSIDRVFKPFETTGILVKLHGAKDGNQETIVVYNDGESPKTAKPTLVRDVLIGNAYLIKDLLNREYTDRSVSDLLFQKIRSSIPETLEENRDATTKAQNEAEKAVREVYATFEPGQTLVRADVPISPTDLEALHKEYETRLKNRPLSEKILRASAVFMLIALMLLGAYALFHNRLELTNDDRSEHSLAQCAGFFAIMLATIFLGRSLQIVLFSRGGATEMIPLLIFVQMTALASSWGVALTFGTIVAFALAFSGGANLGTFVVFVGTSAIVALTSRNVRTRSQLIGVAFAAGCVAFLLSWSAETASYSSEWTRVFREASLQGLWALLAGFLTSGLLPIVERIFGVLTPMRLMEYGNPSHPLLLELNRRAPATYSHSIQTAAIAEAAAEAIGARASLIRVGAYFHDVGKMLQPEHFTENQRGYNIHDDLEPRMSALVIVAHVKDGVDLGKRYHLPRQIVDLIEQHHGTMLVSFFYQRANKMAQGDLPAGQNLDEGPFRYPGPIPQTKEAGILMLADAAESASRSLGDASPGRIENLVRQIADARIEDGQLNDSGLTLGEIRRVEKSLVTSILACRHSRVKYPQRLTAPKEPPRTNFDRASSDVAPVDEYEFVRTPGNGGAANVPFSPSLVGFSTTSPNVVETSAKSTTLGASGVLGDSSNGDQNPPKSGSEPSNVKKNVGSRKFPKNGRAKNRR